MRRLEFCAIPLVACMMMSQAIRAQECVPPKASPYAGELFDAMAQTDQRLNGTAAIATGKSEGVTHLALFARIHNRNDGSALVDRMAAANPAYIVEGSPKRFDRQMRGDLPTFFVDEVLAGAAAGRYRFVGEILYTHGDKEEGEVTDTGERYIDPLAPGTRRLVNGLKDAHVPVMTHWEVYDWARDWPKFDALYGAYPGQIFIWPHVGFGSASEASEVLRKHPNVVGTLSKKEKADASLKDEDKAEQVSGAVTDSCGNLLPEWRDVMLQFSDRLMFATDAHKESRWANYALIVRQWREILGQLAPEVATAIAYKNAYRVYGLGKPD